MQSFLDRFQKHIATLNIIPFHARVLVGYSGGADSTCLLSLLKELGVEVVAVHLNHGLREEATREQQLCRAFCEESGVHFESAFIDVRSYARDHKVGIEEAGRALRYAVFEELAQRHNCTHIATAHTLSDHAETILFQMVRGCGLSGLRGIPEVRGKIVRPLRIFTREEVRAYCDRLGLWYHDDPSNEDVTFSRSRIRHRVVPELSQINRAALQNIDRLSFIVSEEDQFLDTMAAAALEQSEVDLDGSLRFISQDFEVIYDRAKLSILPPVLYKRSLRLGAHLLGGQMNYDQTMLIFRGLQENEKGSITLDGGKVVVSWDERRLRYCLLDSVEDCEYKLGVPGKVTGARGLWSITARDTESCLSIGGESSLSVIIDYGACVGSLFIRHYREGDVIDLGGRNRRLSHIFAAKGVTHTLRMRLPLVGDQEGLIWVPGFCVAERVMVSGKSRHSVRFDLNMICE